MQIDDRELLARTLQAEAGNQGVGGLLDVGSVIMNRVGRSGNSLRNTILKPGQFSAWNSFTGGAGGEQGQDMAKMRPDARAYMVADRLLSGDYTDATGGATHYYNPSISNPSWGAGAGGNWTKRGDHVFGRADDQPAKNIPTGGPQMMQPEPQSPQGLLSNPATQKRGNFGDTLAALAPALGRMGVMGLDVPAQAVADRRFAKRDQEQKASKTIEALSRMNTPQAKQALEYLSAGGDPVAALKIAFGSTDNGVQSSSTLRDRSGVVLTMRDGSIVVKTAGGETISGDAALKFVRDSEEAYAKSEQSIYGARRTGTNEADIETGGTAAAAIEAGKATIKRGFEVYDKVNQTGASISTINSAIDAIDSGAKSGPVYNMLPKFDESSAALNSAMNQMGLDVISSVTFGALSAGEMNLAMETAVPRNLDPQELRSYLVKKRDAQMKARDALMAAARYLTTPGNTVTGWMDQQSQRPAVVPSQTPIPLGAGTISREDALKTLTGG